MEFESYWPQAGDVLFTGGSDWLNACVGWSNDQWHGYAEGYKRAADIIVEHVREEQRGHDYLINPVVFLYRHAIEVSIKQIIWLGRQLHDEKPDIPMKHGLGELWAIGRTYVERVWPDGPVEDLNAVSDVLRQFDERDPNSTLFRYPITKEGKASHQRTESLNLGVIAKVANNVLALLDGCSTSFRVYLDDLREMEAAYQDHYC